MNNEKVCVVMPVYNGEKTIRLALKSLLAQTYTNWECVIVNDGSTDSTRAILDSLSDPRFHVIHLEKNVGRGAARQVCLDNAQGKYLAYLDADDFYHSDKLRRQVEIMERNHQIVLVSCGLASYNAKFELISKKHPATEEFYSFNKGDVINFLPPTVMVYLDRAKTVKYENLSVAEDTRYFSKYLESESYCKQSDILYYYYEASTSYRKIMSYQWGVLLITLKDFHKNPFSNVIKSIKEFSKLIIKAIVVPIMGKDRFVARRGQKTLKRDIDEFNIELRR